MSDDSNRVVVVLLHRDRRASLDRAPEPLKPEHLGRPPTPWRRLALCLGSEPDLWFPVEQDGGAKAQAICGACSVRTDCLDWAIEHNEREGIWGGVSARRRQAMRLRIHDRRRGMGKDVTHTLEAHRV